MTEQSNAGNPDLEIAKLELERYKATLDYRKFIYASVFAAIAIAAIPPLFQLATAVLEYVKSEQKMKLDQKNIETAQAAKVEEFRNGYAKDFIEKALNQDIELRIRFAEYFAYVSVGDLRQGWRDYRDELEKHRQKIREDIDKMEVLWQKAGSKSTEKDTLERHLNWAYKEVGYVERNRSASSNPRAVDEPRDLGVSLGSIQPSRREIAQKVLDTFAAAGFGQFQQVAALANAIAESGLDPGAHTPAPEDAVGLFLLNRDIGLGKGHTTQELEDPSTNIEIVMQEAKKLTEFSTATSLDDAVDIFTRRIERPRNMGDEIIKRRRIARQILPL